MNRLQLDVKVTGEITEEQLSRMFVELHNEVNKFLAHIPLKAVSSPVVLQIK